MATLHVLLREVGGKFYLYPEAYALSTLQKKLTEDGKPLTEEQAAIFKAGGAPARNLVVDYFEKKGGCEWHAIHTVEPFLGGHDKQVAALMTTVDPETKERYLDPTKEADAVIETAVSQWTLDKGSHADWKPTVEGMEQIPIFVARVLRGLIVSEVYTQQDDPDFTVA